jgi:hypothetical protein
METYISEADVRVSIKKHKDTLTYDEKFDFEMETNILYFGEKGKTTVDNKINASQARMKRYGIHKSKQIRYEKFI